MKSNSVIYCNFIIRSQIEYNVVEKTAVLRCTLEKPATGHRSGFTDVDALLAALRTELMAQHDKIVAKREL